MVILFPISGYLGKKLYIATFCLIIKSFSGTALIQFVLNEFWKSRLTDSSKQASPATPATSPSISSPARVSRLCKIMLDCVDSPAISPCAWSISAKHETSIAKASDNMKMLRAILQLNFNWDFP